MILMRRDSSMYVQSTATKFHVPSSLTGYGLHAVCNIKLLLDEASAVDSTTLTIDEVCKGCRDCQLRLHREIPVTRPLP